MNLRQKVVGGTLWTTASSLLSSLLAFAISIVLARLLEPREFGLMSMVIVVQGFFAVFARLGLTEAVIYRQEASDRELATLFWLTVVSGAAIGALLVVGAPLVSALYEEDVTRIARWAALACVLNAASTVPAALLVRHMRFRAQTALTVACNVLSGVVGIGCALKGLGVWSLVAQHVSSAALGAVLALWWSGFRPGWAWDLNAARPGLSYGRHVLMGQLLSLIAHSGDRLAVGKLLGAAQLGFYNRAFGLPHLLPGVTGPIASRVLFPVTSAIKDDPERVARATLRALGAYAFVLAPMFVGAAGVAEPLVVALYGDRWLPSVQPLKWISLAVAFGAVGHPVTTLFVSRGRPDLQLRWTAIAAPVYLVAVVMGAMQGGALSVAIAYFSACALLFFPRTLVAGRLCGIRLGQILAQLRGPVLAAALMAAGLELVRPALSELGAGPQLACLVGTGVVFYAAASALIRPPGFGEVLGMLRSVVNRRP